MTLSYLPGKVLARSRGLVYPVLDAATRTVQVRLEFPNPGLQLKPEMYADVELESDLGQRLVVPETAVLAKQARGTSSSWTAATERSSRAKSASGCVCRRPSKSLAGLAEGERIVTSGNFLVDSESRLKAGPGKCGPARPVGVAGGRDEGAVMVERIIEFSAHNKFIVLVLTVVAVGMGLYAMQNVPLDAIPDLFGHPGHPSTRAGTEARTSWRTRSPIRSSPPFWGAPKVKSIRGLSDFGFSYVYIISRNGTDIYWARSRTLEYLSKIMPRLPEGVRNRAGAGRHRRRVGLSVRPGRSERSPRPRRTALLPGLVPALLAAKHSRRRRSRFESAASRNSIR